MIRRFCVVVVALCAIVLFGSGMAWGRSGNPYDEVLE